MWWAYNKGSNLAGGQRDACPIAQTAATKLVSLWNTTRMPHSCKITPMLPADGQWATAYCRLLIHVTKTGLIQPSTSSSSVVNTCTSEKNIYIRSYTHLTRHTALPHTSPSPTQRAHPLHTTDCSTRYEHIHTMHTCYNF